MNKPKFVPCISCDVWFERHSHRSKSRCKECKRKKDETKYGKPDQTPGEFYGHERVDDIMPLYTSTHYTSDKRIEKIELYIQKCNKHVEKTINVLIGKIIVLEKEVAYLKNKATSTGLERDSEFLF